MTRGSAYRPLVALYERARAREFDGTRLRLLDRGAWTLELRRSRDTS
ncbi:MAG TPA: hypothetical protein VF457_08630 [Burkholderiaceae bacterium]